MEKYIINDNYNPIYGKNGGVQTRVLRNSSISNKNKAKKKRMKGKMELKARKSIIAPYVIDKPRLFTTKS